MISIGEAEVMRDGEDVLILAAGNMAHPALHAAELLDGQGVNACVVNARFVKPIDKGMIGGLSQRIKKVLTVEENVIEGGFGSAVIEFLSEMTIDGLKVKRLGIPDMFVEQGPQKLLRKSLGLDAEGIAREAFELSGKKIERTSDHRITG